MTQALGLLEEESHNSIIKEIKGTLEISFPETSCQAQLFPISKAEGRSAARQYAHICNLAKDADLNGLNEEKIRIILSINSIHPKERVRERE